MKASKHSVLLFSGSLRKASTNTGILRAIVATNHPSFEFQWADISDFPVFNEDVESKGLPESVKKIREQVRKADAVLYAVPQYNFSMASSFKNAYDWISRQYPNDPCPVTQKIGAMVSSAGGRGGERAQKHFIDSAQFRKLKLLPLQRSKIQVFRWGQDGEKFDKQGNLIHQETLKQIMPYLDEFSKWIDENTVKNQ